MAIIKHGDEVPVLDYYGQEGTEECPECGKKLVAVQIDKHDNRLICISCETKKESKEDDQ